MEKINRNDPCPCGSGKKYKKCCGAGDAISISRLMEGELDELQKQLIHFAFYYFSDVIEEDFEELEEFLHIDSDEERQFYELIHTIWFSLFAEIDDEETIIQKFIEAEAGKIKRPRLRQILQTWTKARTIAGKVLGVDDNKLTVQDGFTGEQLDVVIPGISVTFEEGSFFIGMIVPYEQNYVFFPEPFDLPDLKPDDALAYIKAGSLEEGFDSTQDFLTECFIEILSELPMVGGLLEIDELEWPAPIYKEVFDIFRARLESLDVPPPVMDMGAVLWFSFCQKKQKRIQKPSLYAAALHYIVSNIVPMGDTYTMKKLAALYSVSISSISTIVLEMEEELAWEIEEMVGVFYGEDEDEDKDEISLEKGDVVEFPKGRGRDKS